MYDNIKSIYFTQIIFNLIKEKIKLELFKYNKFFQKKFSINLWNYRIFSKKYIIFGANGKAREYNRFTDNLIFEGDYINGKRNGKGEEYIYDNNYERIKIFDL